MSVSEMELIQSFGEYLTRRYKPLELEFLKRTERHLSRELPAIRKFCLDEWRKAISQACEDQRQENFLCAYMSISLMNTSLLDGKPQLQIDFYNEEWVYGESLSRSRMSAEFLFKHWREFTADALDENFYVRSQVAKVEIKSLFWGTVEKVTFLFACYAKYFASWLAYGSEFDDLHKAEKFYVTCGTYLDWQNRIYGVLPGIDLLNPDANEETTFRTVRKKIYRGKKFCGLNLRGCHFEDCNFYDFAFEALNLADATFLRCRFFSTRFVDVKTAGSDFFECYFKDCAFEKSTCEPTAASEDGDEYFAPMRMYHCFLLGVTFDGCDFDRLTKIDCYEKE